jgi:hypothetical protein
MATSHTLVGIAATVVSLVAVFSAPLYMGTLDADASVPPTVGMWVYTPYVDAGDRVAAKIELHGGDSITLNKLEAYVDEQPATLERTYEKSIDPSKRFQAGKLDVEMLITIPPDMAPGKHALAVHVEGDCSGPQFSAACHELTLADEIDVGAGWTPHLLAFFRALLTAAILAVASRKLWPHLKAWVSQSGKSGGVLLPAFTFSAVFGVGAGFPLFARPLAASVSTSSDAFFWITMLAWTAIVPVSIRWKSGASESKTPPSHGSIRFVEEPHVPRSLADLAELIKKKHAIRLRRSGNRLVPHFFWTAPITFTTTHPEDVTRAPLTIDGDFGYIIVFAMTIAGSFGTFDLEVGGKTTRVTKDSVGAIIAAALRD